MTSKEDDTILHLSSLACCDVYPDNVPGSFTNNIIPLNLSPNRDYEVALHGIFIPREIYTLHREDKEAVMEVHIETTSKVEDERHLRYSLYPPKNISSKDINSIVNDLNAYWRGILKGIFGNKNYEKYIDNNRGILSWNQHYVRYHKRSLDGCNDLDYCKISLLFKPRLASILGFIPNQYYNIFVTDQEWYYSLREVNAPLTPDTHGNVDYFHIYCDVVQPTRFGSQTVDILATLPYGGSDNYYSVQSPLYKKIAKNPIDSVAVLVTDQFGRKIFFEDNRSATIVLHIRATPPSF